MEAEGSLPHSQVPATCPYAVHNHTSHFLKILLNIILPSTPGSSKWPLPLGFSHQNAVCTSSLHNTCYKPRPSHSSLFITRTTFGEEYRSLSSSLCSSLHSPVTSSLLGPNTLLDTLFSINLSLRSSLNVSDQFSHPYKTNGKIIVLYFLIFKFLDRKLEDQKFCTEWQQAFPDFILLLVSSWIEIWFKIFPKQNLGNSKQNYFFVSELQKTFAVTLKTVAFGTFMRSTTSRPSYQYDNSSNKPYLITEYCSFWSTVFYINFQVTATLKGTKCYSLNTIVSRTLIQTLFPRALFTSTDIKQMNELPLGTRTSTNTTAHICGRFQLTPATQATLLRYCYDVNTTHDVISKISPHHNLTGLCNRVRRHQLTWMVPAGFMRCYI